MFASQYLETVIIVLNENLNELKSIERRIFTPDTSGGSGLEKILITPERLAPSEIFPPAHSS